MSGNGVKGLGPQTAHCGGLSPSSAESSVSGRGRAVLGEGAGAEGESSTREATGQGPEPRCVTYTTETGVQRTKEMLRT